jgi:hypothetical protein
VASTRARIARLRARPRPEFDRSSVPPAEPLKAPRVHRCTTCRGRGVGNGMLWVRELPVELGERQALAAGGLNSVALQSPDYC